MVLKFAQIKQYIYTNIEIHKVMLKDDILLPIIISNK